MANIPPPLWAAGAARPHPMQQLLMSLVEGLAGAGEQYALRRYGTQPDAAEQALAGQQQGAMQNLNAAAQQPVGTPGAGVPDTSAQAQTALNQLSMIRAHSKNDASMLAAAPSMAAPIIAERGAQARTAEVTAAGEAQRQQKQAEWEAQRDAAVAVLPVAQQGVGRAFLEGARAGLSGADLKALYGDALPATNEEKLRQQLLQLQIQDYRIKASRDAREEGGIRDFAQKHGLDPALTTIEDVRHMIAMKSPEEMYNQLYTRYVTEPHMLDINNPVPLYMDPQEALLRAENAVHAQFPTWHADAASNRNATSLARMAHSLADQMAANPQLTPKAAHDAMLPLWQHDYAPELAAGVYKSVAGANGATGSPDFDAAFTSAWQAAQDLRRMKDQALTPAQKVQSAAKANGSAARK